MLGLNPETLRGRLVIANLKGETVSWETVLSMCLRHDCTVAIIDPFYQVARIVETDENQCLDAVKKMKGFARCGVTLCVVFHSPKGFSGDRQLIDMISGSSILARFPESVIGLLNHATEKTARVVDAVLRNYPPPEPFAVSLAKGVLELAPDIPPEVATARNAWKRNTQSEGQAAVDILPYVEAVLTERREAARRGGTEFRGMCLKALGEYVRKRIAADGKTAPGRDATTNLIKGLPPDRIIIKKDGRRHIGWNCGGYAMVRPTIAHTTVSYRLPVNGRKPVNPRLPTALYIRAVNGKTVNGHKVF